MGKHLEDISHSHIASLIYKLTNIAKESDNLSICFDGGRKSRQQELSSNRNMKGKYHVRSMLKHVSGFAKNQDKAIYRLGCKLTVTRNINAAVLNKAPGIDDARSEIDNIHWYVPPCTPSIPQQGILSKTKFE